MPKRKFEDEELLNLYIDQDLSSIKIAQIFGVRVSSVCRRLQKLNAIKPAMGHEGRNGKRGTVYINGYPVVYMPSHPRAKSNGYVREHILVAEKYLNRPLYKDEVVHHINENKADNRPQNLMVFKNQKDHMKYHWILRNPDKSNEIALPNALFVMQGIAEELCREEGENELLRRMENV